MSYTQNFHDSVRSVIAPRLQNIGFRQRDSLVFTRSMGSFIQVIEFASSTPTDERFTVRLGIFIPFAPDADGCDLDIVGPARVNRCQLRVSLGKILYGKDYIWKTSLVWDETYKQMRDALRGILIHGLSWLSQSSEQAALTRHFARAAAWFPEGYKLPSVPPMVLLGLLYETAADHPQARRWYRRSLQPDLPLTIGLRMWVWNRLHNLPAE